MKVETFQYSKEKGWSTSTFPKLDSKNTLVLVFLDSKYISELEPIKFLAKFYPNSVMIGCSSAGEIAGSSKNNVNNTMVSEGSISVAVVCFERTKIQAAAFDIQEASESFEIGKKLSKALDKDDLKGIFVLSEGLQVNGSELVKGLNVINEDKQVVITGGLAGDGSKFVKTWAIYNDRVKNNMIVGVGFYGDKITIGHGSRGGWDIFGPERRITKSKGNILYELDGRPALELYKEYLGERASGLPATGLLFPLSIRKDSADTKPLVRTILGVDEAEQSLIFAGDVPAGYLTQLMHANFDRLILGAMDAGTTAIEKFKGASPSAGPILVIAISCVGRRLLLGERTEEEVESLMEIFPPETRLAGFYSYGELSPFASGRCDFHNQTMTVTTFREEE